MSSIADIVFVSDIVLPGTAERMREFRRRHNWVIEVMSDGSVRLTNTARTATAPFRVVGVGFSYRTDDDVPAKAAKAKVAA